MPDTDTKAPLTAARVALEKIRVCEDGCRLCVARAARALAYLEGATDG